MLSRNRAVALSVLASFAIASCATPEASPTSGPIPRDAPEGDTGITLAENSGPTLVIVSLDPADAGENGVQVALRDPQGKAVAGAVRVTLSLDASSASDVLLPTTERRAKLMVPHAGHAVLAAQILDGPSAGGAVRFDLDLPAERVPEGSLDSVDVAMNALLTLRDTQTLATGSASYVFRYEYQAPDRVHYTWVGPDARQHETRIVGATRYDLDPGAEWTTSDLGRPLRSPHFSYSDRANRIRVVGRDRSGAQELLILALVQRTSPDLHYRLWIGADDHLVRRYVMMALGHYMTGAYIDFNAPIEVLPP